MRNLNNRQKKAIKQWFEETTRILKETGTGTKVYTIDQMPEELANKILAMNDHETFWQNADRLINDLGLEQMYG